MAKVADMIDLRKFAKMGVRVPLSLKMRIRRLALDLDGEGVRFLGKDVSMEAIFAVAALELLGHGEADRLEVFRRRLPELVAMFEAEMPEEGTPGKGPGAKIGEWEDVPLEGTILPKKKAGPKKRSGNGGEGA